MSTQKPVVMCISGLDPSGGAGIQADIETLFSLGCHAAPVISALTVQDSSNVRSISACPAVTLNEQARAVLEDMEVSCFKLGLIADLETLKTVSVLLQDYASIPVVVDPVLAAGGGFEFGDSSITQAIKKLLIPFSTVATPNIEELKKLTAPSAEASMAEELINLGCEHVLVTGTHKDTEQVENNLYSAGIEPVTSTWPRLSASYHGSGCTLASAVAAGLALGFDVATASTKAQEFTWQALKNGYKAGSGQHFPNRSKRQANEQQ